MDGQTSTAAINDIERRVLRARLMMEDAIPEALPIQELAHAASFSPRHFQRAFRDVVGETVRDHQRRLALERSAYLLKHFDYPIAEVGRVCGFRTSSGYTRAFKKLFGLLPTEYMKQPSSSIHVRHHNENVHGDADLHSPGLALSPMITTMQPMRLAVLRHVGPVETIPDAWAKLRDVAVAHQLRSQETICLGLHNDTWEADPETCRYDAAITVPDDVTTLPSPLVFREIPGGEVASVVCSGSMRKIESTWQLFAEEWLPASGYLPRLAYAWDTYPSALALGGKVQQIVRALSSISVRLSIPIMD